MTDQDDTPAEVPAPELDGAITVLLAAGRAPNGYLSRKQLVRAIREGRAGITEASVRQAAAIGWVTGRSRDVKLTDKGRAEYEALEAILADGGTPHVMRPA